MTRPPPRSTPKPWPMWWVIVAIAVFVVSSTVINLYYRKPGRAHEPYNEAKQRAAAARLKQEGWERLTVTTRRPIENPPFGLAATVSRGGPGLGTALEGFFADRPLLLASIDSVSAPSDVSRGSAYVAYLTASLPDQQLQLGEVQLFRHGNEIVLVPNLEHLPGKQLLSRWRDANYAVSLPTQALEPGNYRVRIVANGPCAEWNLSVR